MAAKDFSITRAAHTGITVNSLSKALDFWHTLLGAELLYRTKNLKMSNELNVVGIPDAILDNALVRLPDGHVIELLEYSAPADRQTFRPRACDVGSVHVALEVKGSEALMREAASLGWRAAADRPQRLRRGDGTLWTAVYIFGPDAEAVELLEKIEE